MIPAPILVTTHLAATVFQLLKNNQSLPDMDLTEAYYFVKAHKLVAIDHFIAYWNDGRFKQLLIDILEAHYPPLTYCHPLEEGYEGLENYVEIAKTMF